MAEIFVRRHSVPVRVVDKDHWQGMNGRDVRSSLADDSEFFPLQNTTATLPFFAVLSPVPFRSRFGANGVPARPLGASRFTSARSRSICLVLTKPENSCRAHRLQRHAASTPDPASRPRPRAQVDRGANNALPRVARRYGGAVRTPGPLAGFPALEQVLVERHQLFIGDEREFSRRMPVRPRWCTA